MLPPSATEAPTSRPRRWVKEGRVVFIWELLISVNRRAHAPGTVQRLPARAHDWSGSKDMSPSARERKRPTQAGELGINWTRLFGCGLTDEGLSSFGLGLGLGRRTGRVLLLGLLVATTVWLEDIPILLGLFKRLPRKIKQLLLLGPLNAPRLFCPLDNSSASRFPAHNHTTNLRSKNISFAPV